MGSEMCIRDRLIAIPRLLVLVTLLTLLAAATPTAPVADAGTYDCLLYTSDAADDLLCVDLGGRRIIKKKKTKTALQTLHMYSTQYLHITKYTSTTESKHHTPRP